MPRELASLLKQSRGITDAIIAERQREIIKLYASVRDDIREELAKAYEKYAIDGKLTTAEMTKYNRLTNIEKSLTAKIGDANNKVIRQINRLTEDVYQAGFFSTAWAIDQNLQARINWGRISQSSIIEALENDYKLIAEQRLRQNGRLRIKDSILRGLATGKSYAKMATDIQLAINGTRYDALRIARTEAGRAQVMGSQRTFQRAEDLGIEGVQVWVATLDARTRDTHGKLDGKIYNAEKGGWRIPGTNTWTPGPHQSGIAKEDINCRCAIDYRVNEDAPEVRRIRGEGTRPYITYAEWLQLKG